jgi:predicted RNA-binding Zn-ribbon protein involved in translation (DUF1610 family)
VSTIRYRTEIVWPPFKGKAHKVVEISTGRGVGLYRTPEGARRKAAAMNREADNPALTALRANVSGKVASGEAEPVVEIKPAADHFHPCSRCGQTVITRADPPVCETCRRLERRSQGETVRLFEPAPNQIPGQLAL